MLELLEQFYWQRKIIGRIKTKAADKKAALLNKYLLHWSKNKPLILLATHYPITQLLNYLVTNLEITLFMKRHPRSFLRIAFGHFKLTIRDRCFFDFGHRSYSIHFSHPHIDSHLTGKRNPFNFFCVF